MVKNINKHIPTKVIIKKGDKIIGDLRVSAIDGVIDTSKLKYHNNNKSKQIILEVL